MKEHPTHKGYYVSIDGKIYSAWKRRGNGRWGKQLEYYLDVEDLRELKTWSNGNGYSVVGIRSDKRTKTGRTTSKKQYVHRMVAETYLENLNNLPEVNHINYIRNDNRLENLEWCDRITNVRHSNVLHRIKMGEIMLVTSKVSL